MTTKFVARLEQSKDIEVLQKEPKRKRNTSSTKSLEKKAKIKTQNSQIDTNTPTLLPKNNSPKFARSSEELMSQVEAMKREIAEDSNFNGVMRIPVNMKLSPPQLEQLSSQYHGNFTGSEFIVKVPVLSKEEMSWNLVASLKAHYVGGRAAPEPSIPYTNTDGEKCYVEPDACGWSVTRKPNAQQALHSIAQNLPHPDIWIEIAWNGTDDKNAALTKIEDILIPAWGNEMEIVCVILPTSITSLSTRPAVPPGGPVAATEVQNEPHRGPYVIYWPAGNSYDNPQYYKMKWHTTLNVGGWTMDFNDVMGPLTSS